MTIFRKQTAGFSLVEVMVALAVAGIITLGFTIFSDNLNKSTKMLNNRISRDATGGRVTQLLAQPSTIATSISDAAIASFPENQKLKNCIFPTATPCDVTSPASQAPFTLVTGNNQAVSGGTNPVTYSFKGKRDCGALGPKCPLAVRTTFWATCSDPAQTTCSGAQTIHFRTQTKQEFQFTGADSTNPNRDSLPPSPPEPAFSNNKGDFSFAMLAQDIRQGAAATVQEFCSDPVALMTGRTADNKIICQCPSGYTTVTAPAAAGGVTCTGNTARCPVGQFVIGYDMATRTFKCARRDVRCESTRRDCSGGCSCPAGYFMRSFEAGQCREVTIPGGGKKGPTTTKEIQCDNSYALCCSYALSPP